MLLEIGTPKCVGFGALDFGANQLCSNRSSLLSLFFLCFVISFVCWFVCLLACSLFYFCCSMFVGSCSVVFVVQYAFFWVLFAVVFTLSSRSGAVISNPCTYTCGDHRP